MNHEILKKTAEQVVAMPKGILAADESNGSANKRLAAVGLPETEEIRRQYRQVLLTTPGLNDFINGVILYDETFWQETDKGQPFREYLKENDIMPGIKVDLGLVDLPGFPNEQITQGLDGLDERLKNYADHGARFAKWRSVIRIGDGIPTNECIGANSFILSRYARLCQEYNIVPMVEPEVLFEGNHSIEQTEEVMKRVFDVLFQTMRAFKVDLEGAILKTSMVIPGKESGNMPHDLVGQKTSAVLLEKVPHELGGVVFLSGGQTPKDSMINLDRIEDQADYPWGLTFSFSRALQDPVLKHFAKDRQDIKGAQDIFIKQLEQAVSATSGSLEDQQINNDDFVTEGQN